MSARATPPTVAALRAALREIERESGEHSILQPGAAFALGVLAEICAAGPGCTADDLADALAATAVKPPGPPPEPPIGTWVRDRHGAATKRFTLDGQTGWAPPGCLPLAKWAPMWEARGPLVKCGPWGADLPEDAP